MRHAYTVVFSCIKVFFLAFKYADIRSFILWRLARAGRLRRYFSKKKCNIWRGSKLCWLSTTRTVCKRIPDWRRWAECISARPACSALGRRREEKAPTVPAVPAAGVTSNLPCFPPVALPLLSAPVHSTRFVIYPVFSLKYPTDGLEECILIDYR